MSSHSDKNNHFAHEIQRQSERAQQKRDRGFWGSLTLVGSIGWMVVIPALLGLFIGHLLDGWSGTKSFWTLSLLLVGLGVGCASAWRYIEQVMKQ